MKTWIKAALPIVAIAGASVLGLTNGAPLGGAVTATDGDSLRMGDTRIRLHGIDAPEANQSCDDAQGRRYRCGIESRDALRAMVRGRDVQCEVIEKDQYGRSVARCFAGDLYLNEAMVARGWAVAYRRYSQAYVDEERRAQAAGVGIWQGDFMPPGEWRRRNR